MTLEISPALSGLVELYDNTASLQDRTVATGILKPHSPNSLPRAAMLAALPAELRCAQSAALSAL